MGWSLIGLIWWLEPAFWWNILKVVVGLGMVIFVHELGHFVVAKLCGVKCEKFYLGFDIGGWKFWKFTWGETEYGIGVLPLGGYVKMLGQEDNPARLREEVERAKAQEAAAQAAEGGAAATVATEKSSTTSDETDPVDLAAAEQALYNPRSYLAKSVPQRMAIISAGVIMNVVFALICAVWAFYLGLFQVSCGVGAVVPGNPAWQADLRPGDQIVKIAGEPVERFQDLRAKISIGDIQNGVPLVIDRSGHQKPIEVTVHPSHGRMMPTIGVAPPLDDKLDLIRPGTTGYEARPELKAGDQIVAIDGQPISSYGQLNRQLTVDAAKPIQVTVERHPAGEKGQPPAKDAPGETITTQVAPQPIKHLGLAMEMGPIGALQDDSPAAAAKLQVGDRLVRIGDEPVGDPLSLPDRLRKLALQEKPVTIVVERKGQTEKLSLQVSLRKVDWHDPWYISQEGSPALISAPALGVAYEMSSRVEQVEPKSPAAAAGAKPGDVVLQAKLLLPKADEIQDEKVKEIVEKMGPQLRTEFQFKEMDESSASIALFSPKKKKELFGWPNFFFALQQNLPGTKVQLLFEDGRKMTMEPAAAADWFNPDRGLTFELKGFTAGGTTWAEAFRLGYRETTDSLLMVFQFLRKLGTQISPKAIGGPVTILTFAYGSASQGMAELLIFLTMISANLAVLNFLPIPVLDGGHMVFLAYEGITGRLPNEKIHLTLTWMGLVFILVLMVWALGLDFHIIPR